MRGVWFVGTTKCPADIENIKKNISEFFYYVYISHKPDDDDERLHIHYVLQCNGTRSLKNIADTLDVDSQYIQVCHRPRGAIRYLLHLDNPEKEQYCIDDLTTSDLQFTKSFLTDNQQVSSKSLYEDLLLVKTLRLSPLEFVDKYSYYIDKLPFYQRIKTLEVVSKFSRFE